MKVQIETSGLKVSSGLKELIQRQARRRSARLDDQIVAMTVRLKDLNGPKGGIDKQCTVEIVQSGAPPVVVSKRASNLIACVNNALNRAFRTVLRKVGKRRDATNALPSARKNTLSDLGSHNSTSPNDTN